MKKVSFKAHSNTSHFHPIAGLIILFVGILGTLLVTHVLAQTTSTIIYACSQKEEGDLRMVAQGTQCHKDEVAVQWNVQGPQGVQGPPGPAGSGGGNGLPFICPGCSFTGNTTDGSFPSYSQIAGKDLSNSYLVGSRIGVQGDTNVDLTGTNFSNSVLTLSGFNGSNATGANFSNAKMNGASLAGGNFSNANFSGVDFSSFISVGKTGNTPLPSDFTNANLSNANFTNADLTGATGMGTANVAGVNWTGTTCPDKSKTGTCVGHFL